MHARDLEGRYTIDGVGRLYTDKDELWLPSVSTVLKMQEEPEALRQWRERTDNYEEVMRYAQNRGTLVHARCLNKIMPIDPTTGDPIMVLWGDDEQESEDELKENGEYDRFSEERDWIDDTWETIQAVCNFDTVLDVETFVANVDVGFAGQFDLLYQDEQTNETVLADLKTSKGVYDKHQIQLTAYSHAVPISIDRMEIIRMNPDRQDWYISSSHDWEVDPDDLWTEFIRLRHELEKQKLDTIVEEIKEVDDSGNAGELEGVMYEEMR